jgi:hypothetical protein
VRLQIVNRKLNFLVGKQFAKWIVGCLMGLDHWWFWYLRCCYTRKIKLGLD